MLKCTTYLAFKTRVFEIFSPPLKYLAGEHPKIVNFDHILRLFGCALTNLKMV